MKKKTFLISLLLVSAFLLSFTFYTPVDNTGTGKYVGVNKCVMCHKGDAKGKQFEIWQDSKHSKAYKTLETEAADKIAKDKGFTTKASETPLCLKCHILGKDIVPDELTESFDKTEGVQCESCHGAGSEYKAMAIMKDKQKSIENGLMVNTEPVKLCTGCHNSESPTFTSFNYDEMWAKIKHSKP